METTPPTRALELLDVTVNFQNTRALSKASLSIGVGEAVAFVGPSGSGKTTALRLATGAVRPTRGHVRVHGRDLQKLSPAQLRSTRSRLGFIHQNLCLLPNLRVWQNIVVGRLGRFSLLGSIRETIRPPRRTLEEIHALLERVGIGDKIFQRTDHLSGGQQQRVAIARALYQRPTLLLADEPVASVDPARARDTIDLLTRICREQNLTLCVSLHDLPLARTFFGRLIGLREGRILFDRLAGEIDPAEFDRLYELPAGSEPR